MADPTIGVRVPAHQKQRILDLCAHFPAADGRPGTISSVIRAMLDATLEPWLREQEAKRSVEKADAEPAASGKKARPTKGVTGA